MFTSRAEYRLALRADNADQRLTPRGIALGCVRSERAAAFAARSRALAAARALTERLEATPAALARHGLRIADDGARRSAARLLAHDGVTMDALAGIWPELAELDPAIARQVAIDARYAVYLDRQAADIAAFRRDEDLVLPADLDYGEIGGLSNEAREKLEAVRPETLGHAGRIPGITPAALTALLGYVRKRRARRAEPRPAGRATA